MHRALARCGLGLAALAAGVSLACKPSEPRTDAEKLARGREIIERMSAKLASLQTFTVASSETRDEFNKAGQVKHLTLQRELTIRRPDRLNTKVSGDRSTEVWYDGVGITLVLHNDKIFGQGRAPETLDRTLDAIYERYGIRTPMADYLYSSPAKALLTDKTTGGWVARETLDGKSVDHLGCSSVRVGGVAYSQCGGTYYQRVSGGVSGGGALADGGSGGRGLGGSGGGDAS